MCTLGTLLQDTSTSLSKRSIGIGKDQRQQQASTTTTPTALPNPHASMRMQRSKSMWASIALSVLVLTPVLSFQPHFGSRYQGRSSHHPQHSVQCASSSSQRSAFLIHAQQRLARTRPLVSATTATSVCLSAINEENADGSSDIDDSLQTFSQQEMEQIIMDLSTIKDDEERRQQVSNFLQQQLTMSSDFAKLFDSTLIQIGQKVQSSLAASASASNTSSGEYQESQLWAFVDMMVQSKTIFKKHQRSDALMQTRKDSEQQHQHDEEQEQQKTKDDEQQEDVFQ